ncbi:MAG: ATP-binding cassette domain-containing protein [Anaerolineae bacterium]|nr:ATP-binding cassette domain-containing protein [Anaerolineae bacterium]
MPAIEVLHLRKHYRVHEKAPGLTGSLQAFFRRRYRVIHAVEDISFTIEAGEVVGFLGPNGAGKTTTLKILAGLLHPTAGEARVLGFIPQRRERAFLRQITLVMGQKQQLLWDLPAMETFLLNQAVYGIPEVEFRRTLNELVELLDLEGLLTKQVRKLSLGERMKCELAAALLHRPRVLFLDEPTIGLDVTMQARIRDFIREYNRRTGATVLLTSHYMADVAALCRRVLVIHRGHLLYDGDLEALAERVTPYRIVRVTMAQPIPMSALTPFGEVLSLNSHRAELRVPRARTAEVAAALLNALPVTDLAVEEPSVEEVIRRVFAEATPLEPELAAQWPTPLGETGLEARARE